MSPRPADLAPHFDEPRAEGPLTEWLLRAIALVVYGTAVCNLARVWLDNASRVTLLMLLVTEGYTLLLMLIARRAATRDLSAGAIGATVYAAFFFVLLDARGTTRYVPELAGLALQFAGLAWQIASKVALGRSFGLLPAHRRIVVAGPYRIVRHPIYFGYLVSHVAFVLVNFSWRNVLVLAALYVAQVYRIHREERVLAQDAQYRAYAKSVRWRLVPGVF